MQDKLIRPGDVIAQKLNENGITANDAAYAMRIKPSRLQAIISHKEAIHTCMPWRLAKFFGTTVEYWSHMWADYMANRYKPSDKEMSLITGINESNNHNGHPERN